MSANILVSLASPCSGLSLLQGFLTMAFLVETLLMGMHKKPNPLDSLVHVLLTGVMIACVTVCGAEIAKPDSFLLAVLRPMVVFFQGTWFWHVGAIMFRGEWWNGSLRDRSQAQVPMLAKTFQMDLGLRTVLVL